MMVSCILGDPVGTVCVASIDTRIAVWVLYSTAVWGITMVVLRNRMATGWVDSSVVIALLIKNYV